MSDYVISCCTSADLSEAYIRKRNISYICMHYELDGNVYADDLGKTMSYEDFYQAMVDGAMTKTSQVNADEYEQYFDSILSQGRDLIHFCLSSGISGSVNSANIALEECREKYPDRKIYVVDSLAASSGFGLLVDKMADLRDEGKSIDEVYAYALENRLRCHHWFFSTDLTYYIRGGRVSKPAGYIGNMLNICPLLNVDYEGHLITREKIRTKKKVIRACAEKMFEFADHGTEYNEKCFISHSACYEDARAVADLIEAHFPKLNGKVEIFDIGMTIGAHSGPGTVALFFWGSKRED
ncbi:MAG: DegV family protein [Lachnospiraceae bacterium]|nr:DegV family protein [Lachnospiraceae bacterium]